MSEESTTLNSVFESQLTHRGIPFQALNDGRYELTTDAGQMTVGLDNLSRQYARDRDVDAVGAFIDSVLASLVPLPDWQEAQIGLFPMIEGGGIEIDADTITKPLSDGTKLILVYFNESAQTITFLRTVDAESWDVTVDEVWGVAKAALDRIMQTAKVSFLGEDDLQLGVIEAQEPYKASLVRAPSLRQKVEKELGWPIFAVTPSRGFVFLISKSNSDQLGRVGASVIKEFNSAEYPISTEVWEVGDAGIRAIGVFPIE